MTQIQWQQLEATVAGMTDDEKQRLASLLTPADAPALSASSNPSLGLFADEPELIDDDYGRRLPRAGNPPPSRK